MRRHIIIPDTQVKPGVPLEHMLWIGDYIAEHQPDVIVHLGDHWDMPSLSDYDKGKRAAEGRRYADDIAAGNYALDLLMQPLRELNDQRRALRRTGLKLYRPELHFLIGNHEERIARHTNTYPHLHGTLSYSSFNLVKHGWLVHDFLEIVNIDGVAYAHYFADPNTGKPRGGAALLRLLKIGFSYTMGHQQGIDYARRYLANGTAQRALVAGACYLHEEEYKGRQGNHHWRGVVVKNEVANGNYDLCEVSLDYLRRRWERKNGKAVPVKWEPRG